MKFSFVIIAYNEENNIAACVDSIVTQKLLGNSYEIIVVDDGSHDKTSEIVKKLAKSDHRVKLVSDGKNHGRGYSRYAGVKSSSGQLVIMVDADILLPKTWLTTCLEHIKNHDVVGGIAVPDGDVAYIYRRFKLKPKTVMGSTTITGNNGMYKRVVFSKVNFDKALREGEDVDFNHHAAAAGLSTYCIPGLTVEHQESKSLPVSMLWLYQSGVGATRQLLRFHEVRLPDLAFAGTLLATIGAIILSFVTNTGTWFVLPLLGLVGASFMHIRNKFYLPLSHLLTVVVAIIVDSVLICCYYLGRTIGPIIYLKDFVAKHNKYTAVNSDKNTIIIISDNPKLRGRRYFIAKSLADRGWDVHYLMWDDPFHTHGLALLAHFFTSIFTYEYRHGKLTVHKIGRLPYYWPYINGLLFKFQLNRLYKRTGASLIFTESYNNETEVPKNLPFIYDLADDYAAPADLYGSLVYKLAFKLLGIKGTMRRQCKNALAVTAVSNILCDFAKQYNKTVVKLPNGLDTDAVKFALENQSTNAKNPFSLIYVTGFWQWSHAIETLEAVVALRQEFPRIEITLIGDGSETPRIKSFIKENRAEKYIHYMGYITDRKVIFSLINESAIGLNISVKDKFRDASFPLKVLEYSSLGKKVVSTNIAEVENLRFPNIFFTKNSTRQSNINAAIRNALLHKGQKNEYKDLSTFVLKKYNWDVLTGELLNLINGVLEK